MTTLERFQAWLDEPITIDRYFGEPYVQTRGARLAELILVNGDMDVQSYGIVASGGLYRRKGLDQDEALELMEASGFIRGVVFAEPAAERLLTGVLQTHWNAQQSKTA